MRKILQLHLIFWVLITISCTVASPSQVYPTQTDAVHLPTISLTETPAPILSPTATTVPSLFWSKGIQGMWFYLGKYSGTWSPNTNELLLTSNISYWNDSTLIKIATPPYFDSTRLASVDMQFLLVNAIWSPDGQHILFSSTYPQTPPYQEGYTSIWIMDKSGKNRHPLQPDRPANLRKDFYGSFLGWIDNKTVVYTYAAGSGIASIEGIDVLTGKSRFADTSSGVYPPHHNYIPSFAYGNTRVIDTKYYDPKNIQYEPPYIRDPVRDGEHLNGIFQDWFPNSNRLLLLVTRYDLDRISPPLQLAIWDLDTNNIAFLLPNAISARVSPDSKTIAYLSLGVPTLDNTGMPLESEYTLDSRVLPRYVQLFDMDSQTVKYSSKILVNEDPYTSKSEYSDYYLHPMMYMAFSPNSKYFAFLASDSKVVLKVVDTVTQKTLFSLPSINDKNLKNNGVRSYYSGEILAWSPDSKKLVYRDEQGNPVILYMETGIKLPLTSNGGLRVDSSSWSFDSHYLFVSFLIVTSIRLDGSCQRVQS